MNAFIIQNIQCFRTQDQDQTDELKLVVYIDGKAKAVFRHTMIAGQKWSLNRHYTFKEKASTKLWEEDGKRKAILAEIQVTSDTAVGTQERSFQQNGGNYAIQYAYDAPPSATKTPPLRPKSSSSNPKKGKITGKLKGQKSQANTTKGTIVVAPNPEKPSTNTHSSSVLQGTRPHPTDSNYFEAFAPSLHGFPFTNSFRLNINIGIPFIPKISSSYGLCGGMASVAADCFLQQQELPTVRSIPKTGEPLYNLLLERQLQTFGKNFNNLSKFFTWWMILGTFKVQQKSVREWEKVKAKLDQGKPVQLGLVYVDEKTGKLWDNHQVLAYDYEQATDRIVYIKIYDPNYPKKNDVYIKAGLTTTSTAFRKIDRFICEQHIPNRGRKDVRGFFAIPMRTKKVPENLVG